MSPNKSYQAIKNKLMNQSCVIMKIKGYNKNHVANPNETC